MSLSRRQTDQVASGFGSGDARNMPLLSLGSTDKTADFIRNLVGDSHIRTDISQSSELHNEIAVPKVPVFGPDGQLTLPASVNHGCDQPKSTEYQDTDASSNQSESTSPESGPDGEQRKMEIGTPNGGMPWMTKGFSYPLIYCTPEGTISIMFRTNVLVEMTVDRNVRVLLAGKFSAASNSRADASCIMHPQARIYQEQAKVYSSFSGEKQAVIGAQGIIFSMKDMKDAYLVTSDRIRGTLPFPRSSIRFPELPRDATLSLFYSSMHGSELYDQCCTIAMNAKYEELADGRILMTINGIQIQQAKNGDIELKAHPRFINMSPSLGTISVRTHYVHMGTQEEERAFIKRGVKRVHVSPCGMVVSDGNRTTSIDYAGRVIATS